MLESLAVDEAVNLYVQMTAAAVGGYNLPCQGDEMFHSDEIFHGDGLCNLGDLCDKGIEMRDSHAPKSQVGTLH